MKILFFSLFVISSLIFTSCTNKNETILNTPSVEEITPNKSGTNLAQVVPIAEDTANYILHTLASVSSADYDTLYSTTIVLGLTYNLQAAYFINYSSSNEQLVVFPATNANGDDYKLVYSLEARFNANSDLLLQDGFFVKTTARKSSITTLNVDYISIYGDNIAHTLYNELDNSTTVISVSSAYVSSKLFGKWGKCVGSVLGSFFGGGSVAGAVGGLTCAAFGKPCAATIAVGCAAYAVVTLDYTCCDHGATRLPGMNF
ncbi:hypothetical protein FUA23_14365 [Neolewinella aurantiaca]|uniref:Lipoprotein n=1 Tax=Neolewinella aurantiaca TaxID=2602767 RepID=A0A5C7FC28_9BACT|nr:hypothetical protein [Neolewinella aurantiaca]TXF88466.1 hypothetical protein FUA23_14365 [Neolewinella aurantiaca]